MQVYSRRNVCTKIGKATPSHFALVLWPSSSYSPHNNSLESDNTNTSALSNNGAGTGSGISSVAVRRLVGALLGDASGGVGVDITGLVGRALEIGVEVSDNGEGVVGKRILLDENLCTHAGVDTRNTTAVARAVDVGGTEADGWKTRVDIDEGVVVVCDAKLAGVFTSVAVAVADKGALPLEKR